MLDKYLITSKYTVKEAIEKMTANLIKAVIIVDENNIVQGLFSNGDMRAFFLKGGKLGSSITEAMNSNPILYYSFGEVEIERKTRLRVIYPIVDVSRKIIDVVNPDELKTENDFKISEALNNVPLVIMAGGKGTRLYPYTKILPKPLIPIGDVSITERIIDSFRKFGCGNVYFVLNYKANMIKAYMNDIEKDYSVNYVEEDTFLGTGGGLRLLKDKLITTFFLSNCDTLLEADFECAYLTHKKKGNSMTFICAMKDMIIPYGVIQTDSDGNIIEMKEKPDYSYLINTGVYIIEPDVIEYIGENEFISVPDLALRLLKDNKKVGVFPISEKAWMDMGQFSEMESMIHNLGVN